MTKDTKAMSEWRDEIFERDVRFGLRVNRVVHEEATGCQRISIFDTDAFGRVLSIDDVFMTSEYDEYLYHEMLVHPAMTTAAAIKQVLVIGGGDGGTVREVLRYSDVDSCVMIEIDPRVIELSQQYLPTIGTAWNDPRLDVQIADGLKYMTSNDSKTYDVIIVDGTDPVGPGAALFDAEFFRGCKRRLNHGGIVALQSESPLLMSHCFSDIQRTLRGVFDRVAPYFGPVPLYGTGVWSWTLCSNSRAPLVPNTTRQHSITPVCKAYNAQVHAGSFAIPNYVASLLRD